MSVAERIICWPLRLLIKFYRLAISPLLPVSCRYAPTCSEYALESIERHGPFIGLWLAICRLCRCHPWGGEGYDPVPDPLNTKRAAAAGAPPEISH